MLTEQQSNSVIECISLPRFKTYRKLLEQIHGPSSQLTPVDQVQFYAKMQDIYSCFYVVIQTLEITLRNKIHQAKIKHYNNENWYENFKAEPHCTFNAKRIINAALDKVDKDFKSKSINYESQDVLARITFGLWPEILKATYREKLFWQIYGSEVFPNKGKVKLSQIDDNLLKRGKLRNRLYHYEPLWKTTKNFKNFNELRSVVDEYFEIIMTLIKHCSLEKYELMKQMKQPEQFKTKMDDLFLFLSKTP